MKKIVLLFAAVGAEHAVVGDLLAAEFTVHSRAPLYFVGRSASGDPGRTAPESVVGHDGVTRNGDGLQIFAAFECFFSDVCHLVGDRDMGKTGAEVKGVVAYARDAVGDYDAPKVGATVKRVFPDRCHSVGNHDPRQTAAVPERGRADVGYATRNRDASELGTAVECTFSNACDSIRNDDARQA